MVKFSRRATLLGAGALASCAAIPEARKGSKAPPNIIFIMADDLGYADLSCFGRRDYKTPVLDRLAAQGTKFTHSYSNSPVCSPTRVALITGRYQYRTEVGLHEPVAIADIGLEPSHPTIASLLKAENYHTSLIGKWHMGRLPSYGPLKSGYDEFWGIRNGGVGYFTHKSFNREDLWDGETQIEESGYLTELLATRAIQTLQERAASKRPFFMSLHFTAPHWPWEGPNDQAEAARIDALGGMAQVHGDGGSMRAYKDMVVSLDTQIGRVLTALRDLSLDQDTLVVFTSDNGGERFSDTWPFNGRKSELLEGGIRVPTIARWPGHIPAGAENQTPIMSMDWTPTFLALAGAAPDPNYPTDGIDLSSILTGTEGPERALFWRFNKLDQAAVRQGRWKYLKIGENSFLFDLFDDPMERANLKSRRPELYETLKAKYERWNAGMLFDPNAPSFGNSGDLWVDRFGVTNELPEIPDGTP
jgi:arylsulfatase A-like enzyme